MALIDPTTPEGAAWIADHAREVKSAKCEICDRVFLDRKTEMDLSRSAWCCWECSEGLGEEDDDFDPRAEFGTYHVRNGSVVG